jgi:hypothetical protein
MSRTTQRTSTYVSTAKMQAENLRKVRLDFEKQRDMYNDLWSFFNDVFTVENMKDIRSEPHAFVKFMDLAHQLPDQEREDLLNAIHREKYREVQNILKKYADRFTRLVSLDKRYACRDLLREDVKTRELFDAAKLYAKYKSEVSNKTKNEIYQSIVHTPTCSDIFDRYKVENDDCNKDKNIKRKMDECFKRRMCGNALAFNNIPENLDNGHWKAAKKMDCYDDFGRNKFYNDDVAHLSKSVVKSKSLRPLAHTYTDSSNRSLGDNNKGTKRPRRS